jgi:hypothetical protein
VDVGWATKDDLHGFADTEVDPGQPDAVSVGVGLHPNDPTDDDPTGDTHSDRTIHRESSLFYAGLQACAAGPQRLKR